MRAPSGAGLDLPANLLDCRRTRRLRAVLAISYRSDKNKAFA